ncbi:TonB-dependent receptor [Acidovorax sp. Be4]|uniref:TonB-dependent receptor n=1 Tax=Acidovorax bellezanensis TaxID=2976702 RepID=A0ABT2PMH1_9BURK|nr:TonB-dependent receptor [Acidovorax sp. Be4]MCT9811676.1 TonB-dependent receptor [Acidovorax sp. Be4]
MSSHSFGAALLAPCAARPHVLALALSAAFWGLSAQAQSLSETVVTAARAPQTAQELLADMSVIDRAEIEASGASGLADVLARLPGIQMVRNGGIGNTTSLMLRGADTAYTAVYIDGIRFSSQSGSGGPTWESIPLAMIDRIEVLRGPAAAIYGSDAIGGVVQIFTRRGQQAFAPSASVGVGSQGTRRAQASVSGVHKNWDYALDIASERSDGFDVRPSVNTDRDGYKSLAAAARLGWQINDSHQLRASLLANDIDAGYDASTKKGVDDRAKHRMHAAGLEWNAQWSERWSSVLALNASEDRYETTPSPYLSTTQLRGLSWQNSWHVGTQTFSATLERREDALQNVPVDRERAQNALALGYQWHAGKQHLQAQVRHDRDSEFGHKNTGSLAYGYDLTPQWRATASAATAFRAPTLYQRFSNYGTAALTPENARNLEAGLRYRADRNEFSATAYRNRISDQVSFQAGATGCASSQGCYVSVAQAQYQGLTLAAATQAWGLRLHGSLDINASKDRSTGRYLARRAKQFGNLGVSRQMAGWQWGTDVLWSASRFDTAANTRVLGGYALWNFTASKQLDRDWKLLARLDNALDKRYETAYTYATAGRRFFVSLQWTPVP